MPRLHRCGQRGSLLHVLSRRHNGWEREYFLRFVVFLPQDDGAREAFGCVAVDAVFHSFPVLLLRMFV